jgi:tetratricopeptide (TPR) repeat protein
MKRTILAILGISVLAALGAYLHQSKRPTTTITPEPTPDTTPVAAAPETVETPNPVEVRDPAVASVPDPAAVPQPAFKGLSHPALEASSLNRAVDLLVSPLASMAEKGETWRQLRDAGKLDQVIAELEQRTASDPKTAAYPAALGQAYLQKCGTIKDVREQGILAMQADKLFDTALNLDPGNWEARFTKAVAMSYWPPMLNKGEEVIQHFQTLIQQQEALPPQPHFAETYAWLGDQYQKAGRTDDARAIWQRGATLFPDNENLRKKLAPAQ